MSPTHERQKFLDAMAMVIGNRTSLNQTLAFVERYGPLHKFPMYKHMPTSFKRWWDSFWAVYKNWKGQKKALDEEIEKLTKEEQKRQKKGKDCKEIARKLAQRKEERRAADAMADNNIRVRAQQGTPHEKEARDALFCAANEVSPEAQAYYNGNPIVQYTHHEVPAGWEQQQPQQGESSRHRSGRHHRRH